MSSFSGEYYTLLRKVLLDQFQYVVHRCHDAIAGIRKARQWSVVNSILIKRHELTHHTDQLERDLRERAVNFNRWPTAISIVDRTIKHDGFGIWFLTRNDSSTQQRSQRVKLRRALNP